jgi:guanylate kinase
MTLLLRNKGFIIILSSPSAAGKSSIARELLRIDNNLKLSVSMTTRAPRSNEIDGTNYYFKSKEQFTGLIKQNVFLEYANIYNNYYGTPKKIVENLLNQGLDILFDIDWQGMNSIKKIIPDIVTIFILPPTLDVLKQRIKARGQDNKESIDLRMSLAHNEMKYAQLYDYVVINDDFAKTVKNIHAIIIAERSKRIRLDLSKFLNYPEDTEEHIVI